MVIIICSRRKTHGCNKPDISRACHPCVVNWCFGVEIYSVSLVWKVEEAQSKTLTAELNKCVLCFKEVVFQGRWIDLQCVSALYVSRPLPDPAMREGWGVEGGRKHLPRPSVEQRGDVPVKGHHWPGQGHTNPNRTTGKVSRGVPSEVVATKKVHTLFAPPTALRPQHINSGSKNKLCTKREVIWYAARFSALACLQIIWDSSGQGLRLPNLNDMMGGCQVQSSRRLCQMKKDSLEWKEEQHSPRSNLSLLEL